MDGSLQWAALAIPLNKFGDVEFLPVQDLEPALMQVNRVGISLAEIEDAPNLAAPGQWRFGGRLVEGQVVQKVYVSVLSHVRESDVSGLLPVFTLTKCIKKGTR